jgi:hypothetical protein
MSSEMVERVARAIDDASEEVSMAFREPHPLNDQRVAEYCAADRAKRIRQARAAVEAMREPSIPMTAAAWGEPADVNHIWRTMVDAALRD